MSSSERYHWVTISHAPDSAGIYVWYCEPHLTDFDVHSHIEQLKKLRNEGNEEAIQLAISFLSKQLFSQYREDPYQVSIRGPLKPPYSGQIDHSLDVSRNLAERIVQQPERLLHVRDVLRRAIPIFSSPLYIGMARKVRTRLLQHKHAIERFRSGPKFDNTSDGDPISSFARQVAARGIPPERLSVFTMQLDDCEDDDVRVIETVLNRINFPILGRN